MAPTFELVSDHDDAVVPGAQVLVWPLGGQSSTVRASVEPWLGPLGPVPAAAVDLVRVAATALIADRRTRRDEHGSRTIHLVVHVTDPPSWVEAAEAAVDLLGFLTGDRWTLVVHPDRQPQPARAAELAVTDEVLLFSGGLDSFCGAVLALATDPPSAPRPPVFVAHRDNPIMASAQQRCGAWLAATLCPSFVLEARWLAQAEPKLESTERSRSLLFAALGVATAAGRGARRLQVPENGWTSLNPPLRANRGGWLSTRSTHPQTFVLLGELLDRLRLAVQVNNPYEWLTKGDLVRAAAQVGGPDFAAGVAGTMSCAKLDGRWYLGGHPGLNCGLCVACLVRRAAIRAAGIPDQTEYLVDRLKGLARRSLLERRQRDVTAVRVAVVGGVDESALLASASLPLDFDVDRALALWQRGLEELAGVDLPT
jgi:hypothetical protein